MIVGIKNKTLSNLFAVICLLSIVFIMETILLAILSSRVDLFIFIQILIYPVLVFLTIVFFGTFRNVKDKFFVFNAFIFALVARFVVVIIMYFLLWELQGGPFQWGWGPDDYTYHKASLYFANYPNASLDDIYLFGLSKNYFLYPYFVSFLYRFIYPHTLVARFANALLGSLTIIPFYYFIKNLRVGNRIAKLATSFYIFSPSFIYFSSLELKDTLLIFICFILLYSVSAISKIRGILKFAFLTAIYFALSISLLYIRAQFFFLFGFFYLIFLFRRSIFSKRSSLSFISRLLVATIVGFLIYKQILPLIIHGMTRLTVPYISLEFTRYYKWNITSLFGSLTPIITSIGGFFLPFPTLVRLPYTKANYPLDLLRIPLDLEIFFTSFITIFVVFSKRIIKDSNLKILLIMALILYVGLLISNFIIYERHRLLLTAFTFIFVAYGIENGINLRKVLFISFGATSLVFLYNIFRWVAQGVI